LFPPKYDGAYSLVVEDTAIPPVLTSEDAVLMVDGIPLPN
jgi:hypothetical protein